MHLHSAIATCRHVGGVGTDHHHVNLHVKSVLDSMDAGLEGAAEPELDTLSNSNQGTTILSETDLAQVVTKR